MHLNIERGIKIVVELIEKRAEHYRLADSDFTGEQHYILLTCGQSHHPQGICMSFGGEDILDGDVFGEGPQG